MIRQSATSPRQPVDPLERLARLARILAQERSGGCQDRLVIGGLEAMLQQWFDQLAVAWPAATADLRRLASLAQGYGQHDAGARAARLAAIEAGLAQLQASLDRSTTAPASGSPSATTRPAAPMPPAAITTEPPAPPLARQPAASSTGAARAIRSLSPDEGVMTVPGVGSARARLLAKLELTTVADLLYHLPARHEDFTRTPPISGLLYGQRQTVVGRFGQVDSSPTRRGVVRIVARLEDQTGYIRCTWFWPAAMARSKRLPIGELVVVSGKVGQFNGTIAFEQPDFEPADADLLHVGRLVPVYRATEGLYQKSLRAMIAAALAATTSTLPDPLPEPLRARHQLLPLHSALRQVHFPTNPADIAAGRRRLAVDELLLIQLTVQQRRLVWQQEAAPALPMSEAVRRRVTAFLAGLPFQLTMAQHQALDEVMTDIGRSIPMSRLLQGDVGSGKTVVAAAAMLAAVAHGYQASIMAPTEILAEQHARTLARLFEHLPEPQRPTIGLLSGSLPRRQKQAIVDQIAAGTVDIVAGTHAVIQSTVAFARLALAVVDEQHRFGVAQRATLRAKGQHPHLLVMTATPIPRSLALTIHGDLDLTIIDEMPPGRQPIETRYRPATFRERAYEFIRQEVMADRQAFIICPLVEESEAIEARAAVAEHERLQSTIFPELSVGLLHGRMRPVEKEVMMRRFRDGEVQILVSTAVVEVGIDIPNATVMLIESADRFGLAQLHQFRGRVGRGQHRSYCLLLADEAGERSSERLQLLADTSDGFALAEHDLRLRGPGEFFGTRQSGLPPLRLAGLADSRAIEIAQQIAAAVIEQDPALDRPEHRRLAERLALFQAAGAGDVS